jgi:hypothetical protein
VVEHVLGKDGVECSIHFGGTIFSPEIRPFYRAIEMGAGPRVRGFRLFAYVAVSL